MSPKDLIFMAFSNLRRRKLRTFLTVFAVVIGTTLLSLMVSLGVGIQGFLTQQLVALFPSEAIMVSANPELAHSFAFNLGGAPQEISEGSELRPLSQDDIQKIKAIPDVERVDPVIIISVDSIALEDSQTKYRAQVQAPPPYEIKTRKLVAGHPLEESDRGKCIIANQFVEVFGLGRPQDALGKKVILTVRQGGQLGSLFFPSQNITTQGYPFEIVGVTERTLNSTEVVIPAEDAKEMARFAGNDPTLYTDKQPPLFVQVKASDGHSVSQVAQKIKDLGLGAMTRDDILGMMGQLFTVINIALSVVGIIALAVASLGIINTLVMAIYERTREIGVMKAVGASKGIVRLMFMAEGGAIGFLGGLIGVIIGLLLGALINGVSHATFLKDFPTFNISVFPWWLILGVIVLGTLVALAAAFYPSNRAARLDPIEALRYE